MAITHGQIQKAQALIAETQLLSKALIPPPEPIARHAITLMILNGIPGFNNLLKRLNSTASIVHSITKKTGRMPMPGLDAAKVTPVIGVALNILDFIQVPLLYLAALALGEKLPITLTNNARWVYAATLLALTLTAIFIPVTAPFITVSAATLGVLAAISTLGNLFYEYYEDKKELKTVMEKINAGPTGQLKARLSELEIASNTPDTDAAKINELMIDVERLNRDCAKNKEDIKALYKTANMLEERLKIEREVVDNCIGITLASLALAGTVVALFFPPTGLIILLTATVAGSAYIAARLLIPNFLSDVVKGTSKINTPHIAIATHSEASSKESTKKLLDILKPNKSKTRTEKPVNTHTKTQPEQTSFNHIGENIEHDASKHLKR